MENIPVTLVKFFVSQDIHGRTVEIDSRNRFGRKENRILQRGVKFIDGLKNLALTLDFHPLRTQDKSCFILFPIDRPRDQYFPIYNGFTLESTKAKTKPKQVQEQNKNNFFLLRLHFIILQIRLVFVQKINIYTVVDRLSTIKMIFTIMVRPKCEIFYHIGKIGKKWT